MSTIQPTGRRLAASLVSLALAGCSGPSTPVDTLPRMAVSGTVTLDGQPLAGGKIQFDPTQAGPGPAAFVVGEIKDGKYAIERPLGPVPGTYKVSISSRSAVTIAAGQEPGPLPKPEPEKVPAKYNTQSTLTQEIPPGGPAILDFDLKGG